MVIDSRVSIIIAIAEAVRIAATAIDWRSIFKKASAKTLTNSTVNTDEYAKRLEETHLESGETYRTAANRVFAELGGNGGLPEEFWREIGDMLKRQKRENDTISVISGIGKATHSGPGNIIGVQKNIGFQEESLTL